MTVYCLQCVIEFVIPLQKPAKKTHRINPENAQLMTNGKEDIVRLYRSKLKWMKYIWAINLTQKLDNWKIG